ncbi:MAG: hypothetical protein FalmKO_02060 [Falsiruegeria mediterranea]
MFNTGGVRETHTAEKLTFDDNANHRRTRAGQRPALRPRPLAELTQSGLLGRGSPPPFAYPAAAISSRV